MKSRGRPARRVSMPEVINRPYKVSISEYDCDEESQYSLSEFSHIHLDGENELDNSQINHINRPPTSFASAASSSSHNHDDNLRAFLVDPKTGVLIDSCLQDRKSEEPFAHEVGYSQNEYVYNNNSSNDNNAYDNNNTSNDNNALATAYATGVNPNRKRAFSLATTGASPEGGILNGTNNNNNNFGPSSNGTTQIGEKRAATKVCRVCGDKAFSYNFNVITCESCKAFFRRNANKEKEIRCPFSEQCDINIVSRRFCQRCRLQKCFNVGMKKEWIMSEEARLEKKQRIQTNRERRLAEKNNRKEHSGSAEELSPTRYTNSTSSASTNSTNGQTPQAQQPIMSMLVSAAAAAVAAANNGNDIPGDINAIMPTINSNISNPLLNPTASNEIANASAAKQQIAAVTQQVAAASNAKQLTEAAQPLSSLMSAAAAAVAANTQSLIPSITTTASTNNTTSSTSFGQFLTTVSSPSQQESAQTSLDVAIAAVAANAVSQQQQQPSTAAQQLITNQQQQIVSQVAQAQIAAQLQNLEKQQLLQQQQVQQAATVQFQQQQQQAAVAQQILQNVAQAAQNQQQNATSQQVAVAQQLLQNAAVTQNQHNLASGQVQQASATQQLIQNVAAAQTPQQQAVTAQQFVAAAVQQQQLHQQQQQLVAAVAAINAANSTQNVVQQSPQTIVQQQADLAAVVAACAAQPNLQQQNNIVAQTTLSPGTVSSSTLMDTSGIIPQGGVTQQPLMVAAQQPSQPSTTLLQTNLSSITQNSQEMIAVPKDILIKLVEHQIESEQLQQQKPPSKCQCHCQCGRYPNDMLIVDKVMTDILENSSKEYNSNNYDNNAITPSSSISTHNSRIDSTSYFGQQQLQTIQQSSRMDTTELISSNTIPEPKPVAFFGNGTAAAVTVNPGIQTDLLSRASINTATTDFNNSINGFCPLTTSDEECLNELLRANAFWEAESGGENPHAITENNLRRLFKLCNQISGFRSLDRHDQIQMLREGCESYFVLRGLRSFNENQIPFLLQNGVNEKILEFYREFPAEWRTNDETVILLLGMLLLFNPEISDLHNPMAFQMENLKYQSIIKRVLFVICLQNNSGNNNNRLTELQIAQLNATFLQLLSHLNRLKSMAMTLASAENVEPIISQEWQAPSESLQQNAALTQAALDRLATVGLFRTATASTATNGATSVVGGVIPTSDIENKGII